MLATYGTIALVGGASLVVGQAILALCGWRRFSWLAPAVGLAAIAALAWATVRLPGEGVATLVAIAVAAALSVAILRGRVEGVREAAREGWPTAVAALIAASIPFAVEGRFGVLGTGFNVDMSQHLFVADWLADPSGPEPSLLGKGYPVGPHSLAVAGAKLGGGNLVGAFGGATAVVPVLAALTSLAVLRELPPARRVVAALLVGLPYLIASYLAQGSFKELYEALFVLALALGLHQLARGIPGASRREAGARGRAAIGNRSPTWYAPRAALLRAAPLGVLGLGAVYSYSGPGLAWLVGAAGLWGAAELVRLGRRRGAGAARTVLRTALPATAIALGVLAVGATPEAGRMVEFGDDARSVANADDSGAPTRGAGGDDAARPRSAETGRGGGGGDRDRFNDALGNLFGDISPLEALGVWPSGDFRVQAGDGSAPAAAFYLGALLAALAVLVGLARWLRRGELAVPAAFVAAVLIYAAAYAFSTPYAAAKALQIAAPLAALLAARELLAPSFVPALVAPAGIRGVRAIPEGPHERPARSWWRSTPARATLAAGFVAAAGASTLVALVNTPVGPTDYSPELARLRPLIAGQPTLALAPRDELNDAHGRDFLGWELRSARPICVAPDGPPARPDGAPAAAASAGIRYVISTSGQAEPPFEGLRLDRRRGSVAVWERRGTASQPPEVALGEPTDCDLAAPGDADGT